MGARRDRERKKEGPLTLPLPLHLLQIDRKSGRKKRWGERDWKKAKVGAGFDNLLEISCALLREMALSARGEIHSLPPFSLSRERGGVPKASLPPPPNQRTDGNFLTCKRLKRRKRRRRAKFFHHLAATAASSKHSQRASWRFSLLFGLSKNLCRYSTARLF